MGDFVEVTRKKSKRTIKGQEKVRAWSDEEYATHYLRMVRSYKTEKCKDGYGRNFPFCPQGKQCFYAHSELELRRDPLAIHYGRGICQSKSECSNGKDCQYAHNDCETMYHPRTYKTKPCKHGTKCERGIYCAFQHEDDILNPTLRQELFKDLHESEYDQEQYSIDDEASQHEHEEFISKEKEPSVQQMMQKLDLESEQPSNMPASPPTMASVLTSPPQQAQPSPVVQQSQPHPQPSSHSSGLDNGAPPSAHATSIAGNAITSSPRVVPTPPSEPAHPSLTRPSIHYSPQNELDEQRLQYVSIVLQMLPRSSAEQSEALLSILATFEEGKYGTDPQKNTALLYAVSKGIYKCVALLANSRTIDAPNTHKQTPLTVAIEGDDDVMLAELIKYGVNLNEGGGALVHALKKHSLTCAHFLVTNTHMNLSLCDDNGNSALILAAAKGLDNIVQNILQSHGAAPIINLRNSRGESAAFVAARADAVNVLILLLRHGVVNINMPDDTGFTPLMAAIASEQGTRCAEVLLQVQNLDIHARDINNNTAVLIANRRGLGDIARKLYDRGAIMESPFNSSSFMNPSGSIGGSVAGSGQSFYSGGLGSLPGGPGMPLGISPLRGPGGSAGYQQNQPFHNPSQQPLGSQQNSNQHSNPPEQSSFMSYPSAW